jgi:multiple sugar transport system ATP-binding protein
VQHSGHVIAGVRPEDFEDAAFKPAGHQGVEFEAPIEVIESMGSEIYAYFSYQGGDVSSDDLADLAKDSGISDIPGAGSAGGENSAVARLSPESSVRPGRPLRLWVDGARVHLFNPSDGMSLTTGTGAGATDGAAHAATAGNGGGTPVATDTTTQGQGPAGPGSVRAD